MAACDTLISTSIQAVDCNTGAKRGVMRQGYLANRKEIDFSRSSLQEGNMLELITFKSVQGKLRPIYQNGRMPYNGTQQELVEGTFRNTFTNTVQFVMLNHDPVNAFDVIDKLANGEFVVFLKSLERADVWQVFGWHTGLHASAMVRELYSDDTLAGWLITLTEEDAPMSGVFATQEAIDDALAG